MQIYIFEEWRSLEQSQTVSNLEASLRLEVVEDLERSLDRWFILLFHLVCHWNNGTRLLLYNAVFRRTNGGTPWELREFPIANRSLGPSVTPENELLKKGSQRHFNAFFPLTSQTVRRSTMVILARIPSEYFSLNKKRGLKTKQLVCSVENVIAFCVQQVNRVRFLLCNLLVDGWSSSLRISLLSKESVFNKSLFLYSNLNERQLFEWTLFFPSFF